MEKFSVEFIDNGDFNVIRKIIEIIAKNPAFENNKPKLCNHTTRIATLAYMIVAIAKGDKIDIATEIISQTLCVDDSTKVLLSIIKNDQVKIACDILSVFVNECRVDTISKLLLRLENMTFKNHDLSAAANEVKQMLEQAQNCVKTKIIQDINDQSFLAIADVIVEMINKPDIDFALLIFQAIDKKRRPDVLSAMDPDSRRTLCNTLKECNML